MDYIRSLRALTGPGKLILNCAGVIIESDGKVLFQRRSDNNRWGLVGGLLELNETYAEAAIREAKEETGLDVTLTSFLGIYHNHDMVWSNGDRAHTLGAYFTASIAGGELRPDEESYELRFFSPLAPPDLFAPDHVLALQAYNSGIRYPLLSENVHPVGESTDRG